MTDNNVTARSLQILLVENQADTLRWLTYYLEDAGHGVVPARTLSEASLALRTNKDIEVVLSDIGLPDGSGWDLLRRASPELSIYAIAMSGFGSKADEARSRDAGYKHHLVKPFKTAELEKLLDEAATIRVSQ